jgi:hypothetical protein
MSQKESEWENDLNNLERKTERGIWWVRMDRVRDIISEAISSREKEIEESVTKNLSKWIDDNVGVSSTAIFLWMATGRVPRAFEAPGDAGDRKRCAVLLNAMPQWVDRMKEIESMHIGGIVNGIEVYPWNEQIPLILKIINNK